MTGDKVIGRRLPDGNSKFAPGDYGRDARGRWWARPPHGHLGSLEDHEVEVHEDGTITVTPSLLMTREDNGELLYHGYLERGVWREA